jgi:hypothetical protein
VSVTSWRRIALPRGLFANYMQLEPPTPFPELRRCARLMNDGKCSMHIVDTTHRKPGSHFRFYRGRRHHALRV